MTKKLGRFLRGKVTAVARPVLLLGIVLSFFPEARACWNMIVQECFDRPPLTWPWYNPIGTSRRWQLSPPSPDRWGIQNIYYDTHMCAEDIQSAWIMGYPVSNDPRYDFYRPNFNTYMVYGPFSLAQAAAARVTFYLLNDSESLHDSIYWGASTSPALANMYLAGSHSGETLSGFEWRGMDLSDLRDAATGDSVSMLGQATVYVFWRFRSDGSPNTLYHGSFVDNVYIAWDDGGMDLSAGTLPVLYTDSTTVRDLFVGDTVMASFTWQACSGGIEDYPPFHVMILHDGVPVLDTLIMDARQGESATVYLAPWVITAYGEHHLRAVVDTLNEIEEANEGNNVTETAYLVTPPNNPPTFIWVTPATDTLWADTLAVLRWEAYDPEEVAEIELLTNSTHSGCQGILLPGGNRTENDGPDSLFWDTHTNPNGRLYWAMARVTDAVNDTCIYAPYPVVIRHGSSSREHRTSAVPSEAFLQQNYPNPFNPLTELQYGIARGGHVSLRVFDVMGREVAMPVDEELSPGTYSVTFDGSRLPTGLYFYCLVTPEGSFTRKMMLLK